MEKIEKGWEIIPFSEVGAEKWDEFCMKSEGAWFRHTSRYFKFAENALPDNKSENISFAVYKDKKIIALVPLMIEKISNDSDLLRFAMAGDSVPFPALADISLKERPKIIKIIFDEIDRLADERRIACAKLFVDPLTDTILKGAQRYNPLLKFGFFETSLSTNIIDLRLSEEDILKNMYRGHATDITAVIRDGNIGVDIFDKNNFSEELMKFFKEFYYRAAGKQTATDEMWNITGDFIKNGYAAMLFAKDNKTQKYISEIIIFLYKGRAYYVFSATEREFKRERGVSHILQWEAMRYLEKNGFEYYEIGWNFYPIISDDVYSSKEIDIGRFKAHFGGEIYPFFRGEKFYNMDYLKEKRETLTRKFIEQYSGGNI